MTDTRTIEVVEHCTAEMIGLKITATNDAGQQEAADLIVDLNEYLNSFAAVVDGKCFKCGASLWGPKELCGPLKAYFSNFQWGIAWGEGRCSCGWPCRGYHRPKDRDGNDIFDSHLPIVLPYHPDIVGGESCT